MMFYRNTCKFPSVYVGKIENILFIKDPILKYYSKLI